MNQQSQRNSLAALLASPRRNIHDEQAMQQLGEELARILPSKTVVTLSGELGAGKSVLARSIIHSMGYSGRVKSPTYTLIETYEVATNDAQIIRIAHMDLYRLEDPAELDYLGFDDVVSEHDLIMIEWPEQGGDRVPKASLHANITYAVGDGRQVEFSIPR